METASHLIAVTKTEITTPVLLPNMQTHAALYNEPTMRVEPPVEQPLKIKLRRKIKKKKKNIRMKKLERFI